MALFDFNQNYIDIIKSSHVLVGGCTGAGKSVCMNTLLYTVASINKNQYILIDNKGTSFKWLKKSPFCMWYVTEIDSIYRVLKTALNIVEYRYNAIKNDDFLEEYQGEHIYIFIDELGDLLTVNKRLFLPILQRIAQIGRGARVHLICGTQDCRKSLLDNLTNNFTCRVGLRTTNSTDSRTITGVKGCENLSQGESIIFINGYYKNIKINLTTIDDKKELMLHLGIDVK